jgi:hypothetical protein
MMLKKMITNFFIILAALIVTLEELKLILNFQKDELSIYVQELIVQNNELVGSRS